MQKIKRVTITVGEVVSRPVIFGSGSERTVVDSNWLSEIAAFLSECGVSEEYTEQDENSWDWLTIRGVTFFIGIEYTSSKYYLRAYSSGGYMTLVNGVSSGTDLYGEFILSFCGNPNGTFVFRIFKASDWAFYSGLIIGTVRSTISDKLYPFCQLAKASNSNIRIYFPDPAQDGGMNNRAIALTTNQDVPSANDGLYVFEFGTDMPLYPVLYGIGEATGNNPVNPNYIFVSVGAYKVPSGFNIPSNERNDTLYQKEILINGRKFLLGGTSNSTAFGLPLIALDEDDPLISEEELMSEVGTW